MKLTWDQIRNLLGTGKILPDEAHLVNDRVFVVKSVEEDGVDLVLEETDEE